MALVVGVAIVSWMLHLPTVHMLATMASKSGTRESAGGQKKETCQAKDKKQDFQIVHNISFLVVNKLYDTKVSPLVMESVIQLWK